MALEGFLQEFGLADILQLIYFQKKTGILNIEGEADKIKMKFIDGNIIGLESKKRIESKRIGKILIKKGFITQKDLTEALEIQKTESTLVGNIFLKRGLAPKEVLTEIIEEQITESIVQLFVWKEGRYEFVPQEIPVDDELPISLDTQHMLMGGMKIVDELSVVEGKLDLETIYRKIKEPQQEQLSDTEKEIFKLIDGDNDVSTIISISSLEDFETAKTILSLEEKGLIGLIAVLPLKKEKAVPARGVKSPIYAAILGIALIVLIVTFKGNYDAFSVFREAKISMDIERLKSNIDIYNAVNGQYPKNIEAVTQGKDSWGKIYIYKLTGGGFILFSAGPDGIEGTGDDVY